MKRRAILGGALAAEAVLIGLAGRFSDFTVAGNALRFVPLLLAAGACFLAAVAWFPTSGSRYVLWVGCVLFRLIALPMSPGDDLWRYLWEGRVQHAGHNPYLVSPSAPELAALRGADWPRINHPEAPAIYPPLAELVLAGLARISPTPLFFKVVFTLADLLTVALLTRLIGGAQRSHRAAWYAWNPAVIYAFAGAGHFDSLMLVALTASVAWLASARRSKAAVALGIAIALKFVPIFLLPVWACALRRRWPALLLALAIPAALTLPYGGPSVVLRPLLAFTEVTRFNDLVWGFLEALTIPNPFGRNWPFTATLLLVVAVIVWQLRADWPRAALWVFGATLLLSPVLHPWYVTWILPFAVWRGQHAWTVLSLSALSAFLLWETTPLWNAWQPNLLTRALVAVPPLIAWSIQSKCRIAKEPMSAR